jgi:hypothetical protein
MRNTVKAIKNCELCNSTRSLTKHHLIPRHVHSKKRFVKTYGKLEMSTRVIMVCKLCHSGIHNLFTEKDLADNYNTKELLLAQESVKKHIEWAKRQK